jgi:hypothetical protein
VEQKKEQKEKEKKEKPSQSCQQSFTDILNNRFEGLFTKSKLQNEDIVHKLHHEIIDF